MQFGSHKVRTLFSNKNPVYVSVRGSGYIKRSTFSLVNYSTEIIQLSEEVLVTFILLHVCKIVHSPLIVGLHNWYWILCAQTGAYGTEM